MYITMAFPISTGGNYHQIVDCVKSNIKNITG